MSKKLPIYICFFLFVAIFGYGFGTADTKTRVKDYFATALDSLTIQCQQLDSLLSSGKADSTTLVDTFAKARQAYKKTEFLVEYYYPENATAINGAPLPEAKPAEAQQPELPKGFQVAEGFFAQPLTLTTQQDLRREIGFIIGQVAYLKGELQRLEITDTEVFDAIKLQIYRIIVKGISGFDAPVLLTGISEASASLSGIKQVLQFYPDTFLPQQAANRALANIKSQQTSFAGFDRAVFISDYLNPLCEKITDYQKRSEIGFVTEIRAVSPQSPHLFAKDALNAAYFAPSINSPQPLAIQIGKLLFADKRLSSNGQRSCASCHQPSLAFTDGLKVNETIAGGKKLLRNTPTLLNTMFQNAQFYDSRINFLEDQAHIVISNPDEMGGDLDQIALVLSKDGQYKALFNKSFGKKSINAQHIKLALGAYVRSLAALNAPFDKYMRGDKTALNTAQLAGFNLFMGKAKCGTCHFAPVFNGTAPPLMDKTESEVLGVPQNTNKQQAALDADSGKYHLYKMTHQLFAFKTPTLRNIALTAPYMHNGIYKTLDEVVDFYEDGGGAGLHIAPPNQTLPPDKLGLSSLEKQQIIAFMQALTDTIPTKPR